MKNYTDKFINADNSLKSTNWFDRADALQVLDGMRLSSDIKEKVSDFISYGFCVLDLELENIEKIDEDVQRLIVNPDDKVVLGGAYNNLNGEFRLQDLYKHNFDIKSNATWRLTDLHASSPCLENLMFNKKIHDFLNVLYQEPCVANQSLYFKYGSMQGYHRDVSVVSFNPPWTLAAAWIALEDIQHGSGPLRYIPGSHKLPHFLFDDGSLFANYNWTSTDANPFVKMDDFLVNQAKQIGLEERLFYPKKGQALIWHHSLVHGGDLHRDYGVTRKSFVIHYTTLSAWEGRSIALADGGCDKFLPLTSKQLKEVDGYFRAISPIELI